MYKVKVEIIGKKFPAKEGKTVEQALTNLGLTWENIKGKGTITVIKGNKKYVHLYTKPQLVRIFSNKIAKAVQARNLTFLVNNGKTTNIPQAQEIKEPIKAIKAEDGDRHFV